VKGELLSMGLAQAASVPTRTNNVGSPEQSCRLRWPAPEQSVPSARDLWLPASTSSSASSCPFPRSESPLAASISASRASGAGRLHTFTEQRETSSTVRRDQGGDGGVSELAWMRMAPALGELSSSSIRPAASQVSTDASRQRQPQSPTRSASPRDFIKELRVPEPTVSSRSCLSSTQPTLGSSLSRNPSLSSTYPTSIGQDKQGVGTSGSRSQLFGDTTLTAGRSSFAEELRHKSTRSPGRIVSSSDKWQESTPPRQSTEALGESPSHPGSPSHDWNGMLTVFLLPNLKESDDFMQTIFNTFAEDAPKIAETSLLKFGDGSEVLLQQLGPVDALEDVQRRARRAAASLLRRWALSWGREFGLELAAGPRKTAAPLRRQGPKPRFAPAGGLPKVESEAAARSTLLVYLVRPFESAKDAERQLGPICIVEASYHGASHTHVPRRIVVALEESSELAALEPNAGKLGAFGVKVQERLRQRGVDLAVTSVERRSSAAHRDLMARMLELLASDTTPSKSPMRSPSTDATATDGGLATALSTGRDGLSTSASGLSGKGLTKEVLARFIPGSEAEKATKKVSKGADVSDVTKNLNAALTPEAFDSKCGSGRGGLLAWTWCEAAASAERAAASMEDADAPSTRTVPKATSERALQKSSSPTSLRGSRLGSGGRPATERSKPAESAGHIRRVGAAPVDEVPVPPPAPQPAPPSAQPANVDVSSEVAVPATQNLQRSPQNNSVEPPQPDQGQAQPQQGPPLIQVGDATFSLPPPGLAVRRISELWRPGATMVVITTDHFGTPLFCPNGDVQNGLINVAPSSRDGKQLVPLFWRNVAEDAKVAGSTPPSATASKRHMQAYTRAVPQNGASLPTMVEEDEEEEAD